MVRVQYGPVWKRYSKGLTNRRALLLFGALMTTVGVLGFFLGTEKGGLYHMDIGQSVLYLILGLVSLLAAETWTSSWKQVFLGLEGVFLAGLGVVGFILAGGGEASLGVFSVGLWENVAHTATGGIFLATALYPRRFRDYSYGTAVSD